MGPSQEVTGTRAKFPDQEKGAGRVACGSVEARALYASNSQRSLQGQDCTLIAPSQVTTEARQPPTVQEPWV